MAKKENKAVSLIPYDTIIEVVAIGRGKKYIYDIKLGDFESMKREAGFTYKSYQKGFYSDPDVIRLNYYNKKT